MAVFNACEGTFLLLSSSLNEILIRFMLIQDPNVRFVLQERVQTLCDLGKRWGRSIDIIGPSDNLNAAPMPDEPTAPVSLPSHLEGGCEVDSSDDEDGFELEPALVIADGAVLAAADHTHLHDCSDDSESSDASSVDE
jgi:hypothetical protein